MILTQKRGQRVAVRQGWVQLLTGPYMNYAALSKLLNLLRPQFSLLSIGEDTQGMM